MNNTLTILLSSVVLGSISGSIITCIFNFIGIKNKNKGLVQIEQLKDNYSIISIKCRIN